MHYGRYSNNLMALTEALGIARATGRTLVVPRMDRCGDDEDVAALYNLTAMAAVARVVLLAGKVGPHGETAEPLVRAMCGGAAGGMYIPLRDEVAPGDHTWRGVAWTVVPPSRLPPFDPAAAGVPRAQAQWAASAAGLVAAPPYDTLFAPGVPVHGLPAMLGEQWLPQRLAALPYTHKCVLLGNPFLSMNWATMPPGSFEAAAGALAPSARVLAGVGRWADRHGLSAAQLSAAMGVHLRLKDIGNLVGWCDHDPRRFVGRLHEARASVPRATAAAGAPVLIATDDEASVCTRLVRDAFPGTLLVVSGDSALGGGCSELAFVQAVLARTAVFVGNAYSTFSGAVHAARVLHHGAQPNTTVFIV